MLATHKHSSTLIPSLVALLTLTGAAAHAAVSVDFRQGANRDSGFSLGEAHWINSIVQSTNAVYYEGMGLAQRVVLTGLPGTNTAGTNHSLTFGHQWTKGGTHAFDWLMSWEQAEATGTAELSAYLGTPIPQKINLFKDGIEIAATMQPVSSNLTTGTFINGVFTPTGNFYNVTVPDDTYKSANGTVSVPAAQWVAVQGLINKFEAAYGDRTIRIWSDKPITSASFSLSDPVHSVANGADTGDSVVSYTLKWTTSEKSTQAVIWMAAHIAVGNNADTLLDLVPGGWGMNKGASQISGGPYHFFLDRADNVRLGNQDNQLKGSSIRALPECHLTDNTGGNPVCPGNINTFSASSDDPNATFVWTLKTANGATFVGGVNTGNTVQVQAGTGCDTYYDLCVTVTDSTGLVNNCCTTVLVDDNTNPTASNPEPVGVQCKADVPGPDITVVDDEADNCGTPVVAFVSDASDDKTCPETITRTYSVTDACLNSINVTQTITVKDTINPTASNPNPISVQCIGNVPDPDITVVTDEADNCGTPVVTFVSDVSDGNTCPEIITRTYSVTDACNNSINVTQKITIEDTIDPTASNLPPVKVQCIGDVPVADITVVTDEADNCDKSPTVAFVGDSSDGKTCPETITRTYSITDDCGNSINVTQIITVDDTIDPTASDPVPVTVQCKANVPVSDVTVVTDEADNCGTATVTWVKDESNGGICPEVITRTYKVEDPCGNSINVHQTITIDDDTNPTASNPTPITVECRDDVPTPDTTVVTDEADNCGTPTVEFVSDVSDGKTCPETITRTYSVTDACGNSINVTQTITVDDNIKPTIDSVPAGEDLKCNPDEASLPTDESVKELVTASDNCGVPTVNVSHVDTPIGCSITRTFTMTATDACDNTSDPRYVEYTWKVDNTPPVVTIGSLASCPTDLLAAVLANTTAVDNCDGPITVTAAMVSISSGCPITVTVKVKDSCDNEGTASVTQVISWVPVP